MGAEFEMGIEYRDIRCSHSANLPDLLASLRLSVLISTYQTGHLVVVAARQGRLVLSFHQFERAMGIAVKPGAIAICTSKEVWFARSAPDIAAKLEPRGQYDACFLARTAHFTGDIRAHESAWVGNEFWVVNTLFSCLAALHPYYSFAPRWRPPFVSALVPEDRCHLNGLAVVDGQPRYATALAQTDSAEGWRAVKANGGCLIEVPSGRIVAAGLSLPHSPRVHKCRSRNNFPVSPESEEERGRSEATFLRLPRSSSDSGETESGSYFSTDAKGRILFLHSGLGRLDAVDPATGQIQPIADLPGVARGLAIQGDYAFVGLSKARPSLDGVPIVARRDRLTCGLAVVDLRTGGIVAQLDFRTGVEEVFDVQVLHGITFPYISGPWAERDTGQPLWTVPPASP